MTTDSNRPTVVVGFDDSPESQAALHWAATEAKARGALLRVVTAWDPSPVTPWNLPDVAQWRAGARTQAQRAAAIAREAVGGGLDVEAVAIEGAPGPVLVEESQTADLLVLGSAGHVGLAGLMAGSVSRHCLHRTACPLVVLGPNANAEPTRRLVLSSTLDPDGEAYDWVAGWLERRAVPIYVVASFDITAGLAALAVTTAKHGIRAAIKDQNDRWIASLRQVIEGRTVVPVEITSSVAEGNAQAVLDIHTGPGDLLVVPGGCEHFVPIAHGTCPIAVVPPPRAQRVTVLAARPEPTVSALQVATAPTGVR